MVMIDRAKLDQLLHKEEILFLHDHPKSYELYKRARISLHGGVPMLWMIRWAGTFPVFVKEAKSSFLPMLMGEIILIFVLAIQGL